MFGQDFALITGRQYPGRVLDERKGNPAFQFFRDFAPDCDWSEALAGEIGDYIVVARRAGDRFFLGAGTNSEARTISIPLDFLEPGTSYEAAMKGFLFIEKKHYLY